jgi:DNA-directed RNA polymerase subunit RPC12/RpoP
MPREVICFECGKRYNNKVLAACPRCGESKIFIAALHSEDYDITKDPAALFKMRIYGILGTLALLIVVLNLTH